MFSLWFTDLWLTVQWITMKTCRIPYEKAFRTGVRKPLYSFICTERPRWAPNLMSEESMLLLRSKIMQGDGFRRYCVLVGDAIFTFPSLHDNTDNARSQILLVCLYQGMDHEPEEKQWCVLCNIIFNPNFKKKNQGYINMEYVYCWTAKNIVLISCMKVRFSYNVFDIRMSCDWSQLHLDI